MEPSRLFAVAVLSGGLCFSSITFAVIDNDAPTVLLQTSCTTGGSPLNNCFTSMANVVNWIQTVRTPRPSAAAPLTVQIGPGTFDALTLTCDVGAGFPGYINFFGAGRTQTTIQGSGFLITHPMVIRSCTNLSFANVNIVSPNYGYIDWGGGGTSVWENVDVHGRSRAWLETSCGASPGLHYWFNSRLSSSGFGANVPYSATCDKSFFYGSDISTNAIGPGLWATGTAELHVYGSNIRVDDSVGGLNGDVVVARAGSGGAIHIHGTGLDATGGTGRNVHALEASSGGMIHANGVGYFLSTGAGGTVTRIANTGGMVMAPYLWEQNAAPQNIASDNGADMQVVTNNADGQPHLVIYSTNCASKWFDTVTHLCH